MRFIACILALGIVLPAYAEPEILTEIPTAETAFVEVIGRYNQKAIFEQFGEPTHQENIRHEKTGEIVGAAWYYSYLNTDDTGNYYQTTELDFVDEEVVNVVFMNNNGLESSMEKP